MAAAPGTLAREDADGRVEEEGRGFACARRSSVAGVSRERSGHVAKIARINGLVNN
jgi:hypothetical protein